MARGVGLMEKIAGSAHAKKQLIMKKIIHSNMKLLKTEAVAGLATAQLAAVTHCLALLALVDWPEIHRDALVQNDRSSC